VFAYSANNWNIKNVHGNVREWTNDCAGKTSARAQCENGIVRGGSWRSTKGEIAFHSKQTLPVASMDDQTGFRIVRDIDAVN
jgi:formylglycine-generating enzyme required for sulfatase activity